MKATKEELRIQRILSLIGVLLIVLSCLIDTPYGRDCTAIIFFPLCIIGFFTKKLWLG